MECKGAMRGQVPYQIGIEPSVRDGPQVVSPGKITTPKCVTCFSLVT
jgi:hypothetical protein